jgi:hypothetical protein
VLGFAQFGLLRLTCNHFRRRRETPFMVAMVTEPVRDVAFL